MLPSLRTAVYFLAMDDSSSPVKRRNAPETRARILAAAQQAFAELGYSRAGIRDIASIAGVSSPLLLRYFGSKVGLYEEALLTTLQIEVLLEGPRDEFGKRFAAALVNPSFNTRAPGMVAPATADAEAREITTDAIARHVLKPLADWLGPPHAQVRALEILTVGGGCVLYGHQLSLMPQDEESLQEVTSWIATTVQCIVDRSD